MVVFYGVNLQEIVRKYTNKEASACIWKIDHVSRTFFEMFVILWIRFLDGDRAKPAWVQKMRYNFVTYLICGDVTL